MRLAMLAACSCVLTALLTTGTALAQNDAEVAARRLLLEQAQAARTAGDHARALDLANRAGRLQMSVSLRMFLAEEQQAVGQLSGALGTAELCVREAEHDPALRNREAIMSRCTELRTALRPRVGFVTVSVPEPAPTGLVVRVGGQTVSEALYGVASVVTPGEVVVEATAPGRRPFRQSIAAVAGQTAEVHIVLGVEIATAAVVASAAPVSSSAPAATTARAHGPSTATSSLGTPLSEGRHVTPVVIGVGAAGVVALGASLALYILRGQALGDCHTGRDPATNTDALICPSDASARRAAGAVGYDLGSSVALGIGLVALAAATVVYFVPVTASSRHSAATRRTASFQVSPTPTGATVLFEGRF